MADSGSVEQEASNDSNPPRLPSYTARAKLDKPAHPDGQRVTSPTTSSASASGSRSDIYDDVIDEDMSTSTAAVNCEADKASIYENTPGR